MRLNAPLAVGSGMLACQSGSPFPLSDPVHFICRQILHSVTSNSQYEIWKNAPAILDKLDLS